MSCTKVLCYVLSVGISILVSPSYCQEYCDYAHNLLVLFVDHYSNLYGKEQVVYNIHGLVHLAEDVKLHGNLDKISCFPFENFLGQLKKMLRKPKYPLQQVVRCMSEKAVNKATKKYTSGCEDEVELPEQLNKRHCWLYTEFPVQRATKQIWIHFNPKK